MGAPTDPPPPSSSSSSSSPPPADVPRHAVRDRSRRAYGDWGERRAATHYVRQGYRVVDRNWRWRHGEVDLVLRRGDTLVFCEVKTRRTDRFGVPALAVDARKQGRVRRTAAAWLSVHDVGRVDVRFDVVAITGVQVQVYEGVF